MVEMVIVVLIAAILVALAVPNLAEFIRNNARATTLNSIVAALGYARNHAVSNTVAVTLCPSSDGATCTGGSNYTAGYIVFSDTAPADPPVIDTGAGDQLLRVFELDLANDVTLVGDSDDGLVAGVTFQVTGMAADDLSGGTHIRYCDDRGDTQARAVEITMAGPRLSQDSDDDGTHDVAGTELDCP